VEIFKIALCGSQAPFLPSFLQSFEYGSYYDHSLHRPAAFQNMRNFYWLLIVLLLSVGQIESIGRGGFTERQGRICRQRAELPGSV
jgi:hypothetical protein